MTHIDRWPDPCCCSCLFCCCGCCCSCFVGFLEHTAAFFVVAANVFYFTLFSAFYSSRDGGLATWEHMFTLQWYQSGGGDVLHYYVLLDCVMNPFVLAVRTGRQRMIRAKKLRKAVCQEQLNQVHTGIELDYMCEYLLALVCPAISIVLCQGLPMLPCTFVVVWSFGGLVVVVLSHWFVFVFLYCQ